MKTVTFFTVALTLVASSGLAQQTPFIDPTGVSAAKTGAKLFSSANQLGSIGGAIVGATPAGTVNFIAGGGPSTPSVPSTSATSSTTSTN